MSGVIRLLECYVESELQQLPHGLAGCLADIDLYRLAEEAGISSRALFHSEKIKDPKLRRKLYRLYHAADEEPGADARVEIITVGELKDLRRTLRLTRFQILRMHREERFKSGVPLLLILSGLSVGVEPEDLLIDMTHLQGLARTSRETGAKLFQGRNLSLLELLMRKLPAFETLEALQLREAPTGDDFPPAWAGRLIRLAREEHGWTQEELSKRAGLSKGVVYNTERGDFGSPKRRDYWRRVDSKLKAFAGALDLDRLDVLQPDVQPAEGSKDPSEWELGTLPTSA
ncbi:MAG TPA: XRE family transcriptional regulator [Candidatus Fraserbacteria bacterium]|nr:XRE family transcriptional regulator [Candidatus Fraserbacteria bacterium]